MSKSDKTLFSRHEHALEKSAQACPECGEQLAIKHGKAGAFFGCVAYPSCQYTRPVVEHERVEDQLLSGSECPECGHELAVKQGRYGMFIGCSNYPACHHIVPQDENELAQDDINCPQCQKGHLQSKTSRFGKTFYGCENYPKCKFVVNHEPVTGKCEQCGFALLLKRQMAAGEKRQCAAKACGHFQTT
ncbi:putative DNA topoisomerase [Colwellia chukchiensis]|uniref:Putative DNA topoisomerase n=1 Tax=Colwellia chukchiensis TaxID=641665 RepID=A0A1H7PK94_9GAMM|nr:topoisomerase DNA-binding C4 zinc finger domain-containing protein [Colwellia chukchiensis]SEL35844.1 putative DNA topoisomerase [Colwellia chukchiensis]